MDHLIAQTPPASAAYRAAAAAAERPPHEPSAPDIAPSAPIAHVRTSNAVEWANADAPARLWSPAIPAPGGTSLRVRIIDGVEANALLADQGFIDQWEALYDACPWATVLQSPAFALAWYTTYRPQFDPVLVVAHDAAQRLVGLLALGHSTRGRLVVAGAEQAEYQVWIARAELGNLFPVLAFQRLRRRFPTTGVQFRYLPPGTPLDWLDEPAGRHCLLTPFDRPVMELADRRHVDTILKRRNIRTRLNKFRQAGFTGIEHITDPAELETCFDELIGYHELRRIAVSGVAPFLDDPLKKPFHIEMMKRGVLCVTALRAGGRVVSLQMDMIGRGEVHLALGAYAPWVSRFAPGKIHILEFARMLADRGCRDIDLTPGADPYKGEFATRWDRVHALVVSPTHCHHHLSRARRVADGVVRALCRRFDTEPVRLKMFVRDLVTRPAGTIAGLLRQFRHRVRPPAAPQVSTWAIEAPRLAAVVERNPSDVRFNCIDDLLAYQPTTFSAPRHAFLADAGQRFAEGMQAYTLTQSGRLTFSAWLTDQPEKVLDSADGGNPADAARPAADDKALRPATTAAVATLEGAVLVFDLRAYPTAPPSESALTQALRAAARTATEGPQPPRHLLVTFPIADTPTRHLLERLGFIDLPLYIARYKR